MKKIPTMQEVLQYKNPYVIQRYQKDFPDRTVRKWFACLLAKDE
jgi:hypothetical protein